ncbi:hypothetical protein [Xanthomonas graminis]|uniref:hypothetical protein n=1 Tax=Xanthomonas graminis TaxID=3390026 RepID=UPI00069DA495|nr:hypothetical protein [Xanthomonas translucens]UKE54965.1 hypothetical protein KFS84_03545 [Xanthomonas translucens pv. graminis]WIH12644.1 hypothetical protein KM563_01965 [Xanthomonas translucens pv. graminis]WIH15560.1 hypothetical protein KM433_17495 [Xanthomonas translucens pv. graminis]SBV43867.1 hypothetical protein XTGART2_2982 [Xanthomonas translucens pv. graminis]SBV48299.1 hypothetical protein XTGART29_2961 [Xanthomonas translucens pv. graminis ART-Xtg29]
MPGADLVSAMQQLELSNASSDEISQKQQELYKAINKAQFLHSTYLNNAHNTDAKEKLAPADLLRFTDNAIKSAKDGLETFAYLKARRGLQEENAWKLESQLLTLLGRAATVGYLGPVNTNGLSE